MLHSYSFSCAKVKRLVPKENPNKWEKIQSFYEQKQYKESFELLLDYVHPHIKKYQTAPLTYRIPHGDIFVLIELKEDIIEIKSPFIKLKDKGEIAIQRTLLELYSDLRCINIVLNADNNEISFLYRDGIEFFEPTKLLQILKNFCTYPQLHLLRFCHNFNSEPLLPAYKITYNSQTLQNLYNIFQEKIQLCFEHIHYLEEKRLPNSCYNNIQITLKSIVYSLSIVGFLKFEIREKVYEMRDATTLMQAISKGKTYLEKLQKMSKEDLSNYLYQTELFVSNRYYMLPEDVRSYQKETKDNVINLMSKWEKLEAHYIMYHDLYSLLYHYDLSPNTKKSIERLLAAVSGKNIEEASNILFEWIQELSRWMNLSLFDAWMISKPWKKMLHG